MNGFVDSGVAVDGVCIVELWGWIHPSIFNVTLLSWSLFCFSIICITIVVIDSLKYGIWLITICPSSFLVTFDIRTTLSPL